MDCPPGSSQEMRPSGWGGRQWGEGRAEAETRHPLPILPMAAVRGAVGPLLLTSASFQSPGMQKDSSRSLPHSSKIRSSGEREQSWHRDEWRPGKYATLSLAADKYRSLRFLGLQHPCPPGSPAPWCVRCRHLCLPGSFTDHSCPLCEELLIQGGSWFAWYRGVSGDMGPSMLNQDGWASSERQSRLRDLSQV